MNPLQPQWRGLCFFFAQGVTPTPNVAQHLDPYPSLFNQSFVCKTSASPPKFPGQQFAYSFLENSFLPSLTPFRPPATMIGFLMIVAALLMLRSAGPVLRSSVGYRFWAIPESPHRLFVPVFVPVLFCPWRRGPCFLARCLVSPYRLSLLLFFGPCERVPRLFAVPVNT